VDHVADVERRDVDRELDRDVARLGAHGQAAQHDADLAAVDRARGLAGELQRHLGADFLVRVDREQVDVGDVVAQRIDLHVLDQRVQRARRGAAFDREADHRVALADRVERAAQLLDVDGDRKRLDATLDRRPVADAGDLALRAKLARTALARATAKRDCELSDFHDVLQSTYVRG
jgi:hypothetical protein